MSRTLGTAVQYRVVQVVQTYKGGKNYKLELRELLLTASMMPTHRPLIKELGWLTIKQLIDPGTVKIVDKALHNEAPKYLRELFHKLSDIQNK